ncbi:hypothetical protein BVC80_8981g22 [Macleaya cordata]|uniref:Uncharacterized protein n=1 Tax=Macleaya cordata TaxID=56857 RepID=A0A200Q7F4_MACCD|nr:hypothetical protein BVC80_263g17 [Macleaya cordata]OVA06385.1 hypothetical protein BVC80_8981g22 [Macleaya cordata]
MQEYDDDGLEFDDVDEENEVDNAATQSVNQQHQTQMDTVRDFIANQIARVNGAIDD